MLRTQPPQQPLRTTGASSATRRVPLVRRPSPHHHEHSIPGSTLTFRPLLEMIYIKKLDEPPKTIKNCWFFDWFYMLCSASLPHSSSLTEILAPRNELSTTARFRVHDLSFSSEDWFEFETSWIRVTEMTADR